MQVAHVVSACAIDMSGSGRSSISFIVPEQVLNSGSGRGTRVVDSLMQDMERLSNAKSLLHREVVNEARLLELHGDSAEDFSAVAKMVLSQGSFLDLSADILSQMGEMRFKQLGSRFDFGGVLCSFWWCGCGSVDGGLV